MAERNGRNALSNLLEAFLQLLLLQRLSRAFLQSNVLSKFQSDSTREEVA